MLSLCYSPHLTPLLNSKDISSINSYLDIQAGRGVLIADKHFAIRKSNGLTSFERIDIYVAPNGLIFLSSFVKSDTQARSILS
ncbi:MAG: Unknown protein [uncultured Sulfurovum sp.]|uniref:Uncharacterized protein n=1 Tax=uncultured Sulfurovum sp. TaxID=269237 RepID=A0A6S6SS37_9BACT|nr:MAG: Unknown protein [uncultured Sulfurovum sp.]